MLKLKHRLNLQAFAEGFESAGDVGGTDGSTDTGLANQTDDDSDLFAYEDEEETQTASSVSSETDGQNDGDDYQMFREKYKDRIGQDIQDAIQKRFKNQQSWEDQYNHLADGLAPLYLKYGLDGSNVDELLNALAKDDSLLEDVAFDKGMSTEAVRETLRDRQENARLQKELDKYRQEQIEAQASRDAYNQYNEWMREAEELKQLYPNFNLENELDNEEFRNDLINSGKSLRKVYESAHLQEIIEGAIQTTAMKAREAVTNNIRSRGMRPTENGQRTGSVKVKKDVNDLTDKDIDRLIARARAGEKVTF